VEQVVFSALNKGYCYCLFSRRLSNEANAPVTAAVAMAGGLGAAAMEVEVGSGVD